MTKTQTTTPPTPTLARPEALYHLAGLTRIYGDGSAQVRALNGIDFEVVDGEFVAVVGPSGSGKSTLLQLLGALDRASSGTIEFEGRDLSRLSDRELTDLRLQRLGFVFQHFNLIPTLSARENVEVAMAPRGISSAERSSASREMLHRVGLDARTEHLPSELSGGEQQRVAIARALVNEPDVLLADEPTGNLDSNTGDAIIDLLVGLWREEGLSIVLITHDSQIASRAPRLIRLADGEVAEELAGRSVERGSASRVA